MNAKQWYQRSTWGSARIMAMLLRAPPTSTTTLLFPLKRFSSPAKMRPATASLSSSAGESPATRKLPVLLFDIMDTIVRDPFYHDVPNFFGMSMKELIERKHPTAWIEFEKGLINEEELAKKFFKDGRAFDLEGLKKCMVSGYSYLDGVEELLHDLKQHSYEMHAFTNYPIWYEMIEDKLRISTYLSWTFCSCATGKRKPDPDFYLEAVRHLGVDPSGCIFIDDRKKNVDAAVETGIVGLQFKNADSLRADLAQMGIDIPTTFQQTNT